MKKANFTSFLCILLGLVLPLFSYADGDVLCMEYAFQLALMHYPPLSASRALIEMRIGDHIQSGAYPNPYFSYSVENIFGNKRWKGWNAAESRYELLQPIVLSNKRTYRTRASFYEYSSAVAEYASQEWALFNAVKKAFLEVLGREELYHLAEEKSSIAEEIVNAISTKMDSGKISLIEKNKAFLEKVDANIMLKKALQDFESAKEELKLFFGASCIQFDSTVYPFYEIESFACLDTCLENIQNHPDLMRAKYNYLASRERLKEEKAERIPDLSLTIGYKTERERHERGMILGAALPLPLFDWNEGNIRKREADIEYTSSLFFDIEAKLKSKVAISHKEACTSYQEVMQLKNEVLQLAEENYLFVKQGYNEGKFEYLELLDAQKTLFEIRARYIQALLQFLKKKTDIEYLTI